MLISRRLYLIEANGLSSSFLIQTDFLPMRFGSHGRHSRRSCGRWRYSRLFSRSTGFMMPPPSIAFFRRLDAFARPSVVESKGKRLTKQGRGDEKALCLHHRGAASFCGRCFCGGGRRLRDTAIGERPPGAGGQTRSRQPGRGRPGLRGGVPAEKASP
jgi:hypothetical protein